MIDGIGCHDGLRRAGIEDEGAVNAVHLEWRQNDRTGDVQRHDSALPHRTRRQRDAWPQQRHQKQRAPVHAAFRSATDTSGQIDRARAAFASNDGR